METNKTVAQHTGSASDRKDDKSQGDRKVDMVNMKATVLTERPYVNLLPPQSLTALW